MTPSRTIAGPVSFTIADAAPATGPAKLPGEPLQGDRLAVSGSVYRARNTDRRAKAEAFILHGLVVACLLGLIAGAVLLGMRP